MAKHSNGNCLCKKDIWNTSLVDSKIDSEALSFLLYLNNLSNPLKDETSTPIAHCSKLFFIK